MKLEDELNAYHAGHDCKPAKCACICDCTTQLGCTYSEKRKEGAMETGKVEYAPDYRSKSQVKRIAVQKGLPPDSSADDIAMLDRLNANEAAAAERSRLERDVIEAAKDWSTKRLQWKAGVEAESRLCKTISALIDFESQQHR